MDNFDDLRAALVSRDELYVFDRTPALLAERDALAARIAELEAEVARLRGELTAERSGGFGREDLQEVERKALIAADGGRP